MALFEVDSYYVYALCDPRKPGLKHGLPYEPFYIGKGRGRRMFKHFGNGKYEAQYNPHKARKIAKIKSETGRDAVVVMLGWDLTESAAFDLEEEVVSIWGRKHLDIGGVLTNVKTGGEGSISYRTQLPEARKKGVEARIGRALSDEVKAKIRAKATGRRHSPDTCEKIRQIRLSCQAPVSDATRQKLRELHKGKPKPEGFGECIRQMKLGKPRPDNVKTLSKQVSMYSLLGELLGTYSNGRVAQVDTSINYKAISACCSGRRRTCWLGDKQVTFRFGAAEFIEILTAEEFRSSKKKSPTIE